MHSIAFEANAPRGSRAPMVTSKAYRLAVVRVEAQDMGASVVAYHG